MRTRTRVYLVTVCGEVSLIRAISKAEALRYAVRGMTEVRIASQDDILAVVEIGGCVESARRSEAK